MYFMWLLYTVTLVIYLAKSTQVYQRPFILSKKTKLIKRNIYKNLGRCERSRNSYLDLS